jgi:hypothetical protein
MKDALGIEIQIGQRYGYSRNENGFTYVRIGIISKINEKTVTMNVEITKKALYSDDLEIDPTSSRKISIKGNMLFPVNTID